MLRGLWKVARFEYSRIVFRKRFILVLLSPILILVLTGLASMITVFSVLNKKPVGYVDLTGRIEEFVMQGENAGRFDTEVELRAFPDESSGRAALDAEQLEALYIIEEDYFETGRVRMTAYQIPDDEVQEAMEDLLRQNLAALQPEDIAVRLLEGSELEVIDNGEKVEGAGLGLISQIAVPMVFALLFTVIIGVTSGYMLNAVVDEKTNFTAEILLTSVSPTQLMAGKMIGNLAIGLTQLLVWGGIPLLAIGVAAAYFPILAFLEIDAGLVWVSFGLVILGVLQISALLTVLGATVAESREAQQVSSLITFVFMVPYFFLSKLMFEPGSTAAVVLSIFPLTAPLSMPFRMSSSSVPVWQIIFSFGLSLAAVAGMIWLAGVAFHRGILQYDRRLRLKELFQGKGRQQ